MNDLLTSRLLNRGIPAYYNRIIEKIVRRFSFNDLSQRDDDYSDWDQGNTRVSKFGMPFSLKN